MLDKLAQVNPDGQHGGIAVDLVQPDAPAQVVDACLQTFPHIDILVNNAGVDLVQSLADTTIDEYQRVMDVNLRAPYFLIQAAMPHIRKPGRIINISSIAARSGFPIGMVYAMSKAGLEGLTRSMAKAFGGDGTTVNAVAPGLVQTEMLGRWEPEWIAEDAARTPVQRRVGTPDDVAQVVAWLASEQSRWVSGQTISACGAVILN